MLNRINLRKQLNCLGKCRLVVLLQMQQQLPVYILRVVIRVRWLRGDGFIHTMTGMALRWTSKLGTL